MYVCIYIRIYVCVCVRCSAQAHAAYRTYRETIIHIGDYLIIR
jgi:hypothetical protein